MVIGILEDLWDVGWSGWGRVFREEEYRVVVWWGEEGKRRRLDKNITLHYR